MYQEQENNQVDGMNGENESKKKPKGTFAKLLISAAVIGLIAGGINVGIKYIENRPVTAVEDIAKESDAIEDTTTKEDEEQDSYTGVSEIVANVKPSIVAITSTVKDVSYDLFGRPHANEAKGAGSGIIIGENGYELLIATNNHVVEGASTIVIEFVDGSTIEGTVKGSESASDLAVVSVSMKDLSKDTLRVIRVATLGNSDQCQQGELVVAIGNALGYGQSTTVGYVSALNREVEVDDATTLTLLQTDAAINPGNSGGALINARGEVIGINSVKYVKTEVEGIGYAIPISCAVPIINDLMNRENLSTREQGYLGIVGEDVTKSNSTTLNLPVGVYINSVVKGSAAEKAGLKQTDIIVGIGGRTIETMEELQSYLNYTRAGSTVTVDLKVRENGEYIDKSVEVTLGQKR